VHYNSVRDCKQLFVSRAIPGLTVAALSDLVWYRAEILYFNGKDVFANLVDFGIRKFIPLTNIRYLEKIYASPSRKACKGGLFGVKPKNGEVMWSTEATMNFMRATKGLKMYAIVKAYQEGIYQIELVGDRRKQSSIATEMVLKGFADVDDSGDSSKYMNAILVSC
jgi:hypothetical protein